MVDPRNLLILYFLSQSEYLISTTKSGTETGVVLMGTPWRVLSNRWRIMPASIFDAVIDKLSCP